MLVTVMQRHEFELSGGHVALDFANTVDGSRSRPKAHEHGPADHLATYADLLEWATQAGLITEAERRRLARSAAERPGEAAATHRRAVELREAIFRVFDARAVERAEPSEAIATIDRENRVALAHRMLRRHDGSVVYAWRESDELDRPLWAVAIGAAELLTSPDVSVVKECASEVCDWLFVDRSRNRSRRWCDMSDCGNRAKARRFHARRRSARA